MFPAVAEYGQVKANDWPLSKRYSLESGKDKHGKEVRLIRQSEGYAIAGSAMLWRKSGWVVGWPNPDLGDALWFMRFSTEHADESVARAKFATVIGEVEG